MIFSYFLFAVLAIGVFIVGRHWRRWLRLSTALVTFLVPSLAVTILLLQVGDSALPGATTVQSAAKWRLVAKQERFTHESQGSRL